MPANTDIFIPFDGGDFLRKVTNFDAGYSNDGVFGFIIDGVKYQRQVTAVMNAQTLGIKADGTAQASLLHTICANPDVKTIEFNYVKGGGAITLNGNFTATGKVLKVRSGTYFTGSGTITGGTVEAGDHDLVFAGTIVPNLERCSRPYISAKWFGALGNGTGDDSTAINRALQCVIKNTTLPNTVFLPKGNYRITSPIIAYNWDGAEYQFMSFHLKGSSTSYFTSNENETIITCTYKNTFAIGVHLAKTFLIEGLSIKGQFAASFPNYKTFAATSYADFGGAHGCREDGFSPYSGIVVDPFRSDVPTGGGYPGLTSYYRGTATGGGTSAGNTINCRVAGFICDICYSPNGQTQNCESMIIEKCAIEICKVGVSYCQDQTKNCVIRNCISWDTVHTLISNSTFGNGHGCPPAIHTLDIAGLVNQLFNIDATGRFGFSADNLYCESLFRIGNLTGMPAQISNSHIDFASSNVAEYRGTPDYYFRGQNVVFTDCVFRLYDNLFNKRLHMNAIGCTFIGCQFDVPPIFQARTDAAQPNLFVNCKYSSGGTKILGDTNSSAENFSFHQGRVVGNYSIEFSSILFSHTRLDLETLGEYEQRIQLSSIVVTVDPVTASATFPLTDANKILIIGDYIFADGSPGITLMDEPTVLIGNPVLGRVSTVTSTTVTLTEVPVNAVSGTYVLWYSYFKEIFPPFMGDVTSGSAVISNVAAMESYPAAGVRVRNKLFTGIVDSTNTSAKTITLKVASPYTETDLHFTDAAKTYIKSPFEPGWSGFAAETIPVMPGTEWDSSLNMTAGTNKPQKWIFSKGGYIDYTMVSGAPSSRQSVYTEMIDYVQQTLAAYTTDPESATYTGIDNAQVGSVYAQLTDLNALRTAFEVLRLAFNDLRTKGIASKIFK